VTGVSKRVYEKSVEIWYDGPVGFVTVMQMLFASQSNTQHTLEPGLMPTDGSLQPATGTYPSDMTEEQWRVLEPLLPVAKPGGRPRAVDLRAVVNGVLYVLRSGCAWRMLPHDFPPWPTVYYYFWSWRRDGTWERLQQALCAQVRVQAGREASPSAAIIDSQTVKTTEKGGRAVTMPARR